MGDEVEPLSMFPLLPKASVGNAEKELLYSVSGHHFFFYPHIEMLGFHLTTFSNFHKL